MKKRADYLRVQSAGKKLHGTFLLALVGSGSGMVGITVSKRVGGAVVRNRIKRRLREILRGAPAAGEPIKFSTDRDVVLIAKDRARAASFCQLQGDLRHFVCRL